MNGYECPCCGEMIWTSREMRDCPTCLASVRTQRIARMRKAERMAMTPPFPTRNHLTGDTK